MKLCTATFSSLTFNIYLSCFFFFFLIFSLHASFLFQLSIYILLALRAWWVQQVVPTSRLRLVFLFSLSFRVSQRAIQTLTYIRVGVGGCACFVSSHRIDEDGGGATPPPEVTSRHCCLCRNNFCCCPGGCIEQIHYSNYYMFRCMDHHLGDRYMEKVSVRNNYLPV